MLNGCGRLGVVRCVLRGSFGLYSTCIGVGAAAWFLSWGRGSKGSPALCCSQPTVHACACNVGAALDQHDTHAVGMDVCVLEWMRVLSPDVCGEWACSCAGCMC